MTAARRGAPGEQWPPPAQPPGGQTWRLSAKAVIRDTEGRVLLLHLTDAMEPQDGDWWELPGGGVEQGETPEEAVVREIAEETGLVVPVAAVAPVAWRRTATFRSLGRRRWQQELVHLVDLSTLDGEPGSVPLAPTPEELKRHLGQRWWTIDEIVALANGARFYPGRLPELLPRMLAGEAIDEPFETWG